MNAFSEPELFLDSVLTEIEVGCLPDFLHSLSEHEIDALVVLGPDITSNNQGARSLRTMYPWNFHRSARAIASCQVMAEMDCESAPLVNWINLQSSQFKKTGWAHQWIKHGYQTMLLVKIPIAMDRHFECLLFSKLQDHSKSTAASITLKTMEAWPRIKHEIVTKQQILSHQEKLVLRLSAEGETSQQAATRCSISERMVNFHMGNCLRKLGAPNKTAAVLRAIMAGII